MSDASADFDELLRRKSRQDCAFTPTPERVTRLRELRAWQAARLGRTYDDLLRDPRSADAVKFFLSDLYAPREHTRRDQDLMRASTRLKRTLPGPLLGILARVLELQVLTAQLDQAMVESLAPGPLSAASYAAAYRAVGQAEARKRQIDLVVGLGADLDRVVRHDWIAIALRAARLPAHLAGFGTLHDFLERGFGAFRRMPDARRLLNAVRDRESHLSAALLSGDDELLDFAATTDSTSGLSRT